MHNFKHNFIQVVALILIFGSISELLHAQKKSYKDKELDSLYKLTSAKIQKESYYDAMATINLLTNSALKKKNDYYLACSYNTMALAYTQHYAYDKALENYLKAIDIFDKLDLKINIYGNLAQCYLNMGDVSNFKKYLKISKSRHAASAEVVKYWDYRTLAMWYFKSKKFDSLEYISNRVLKELSKSNIGKTSKKSQRQNKQDYFQTTFELYLAYGLTEQNKSISEANTLLNKNLKKNLEDILWFSSELYESYYSLNYYKSQILIKSQPINLDSVKHFQLLADKYFTKGMDLVKERSANNVNYLSNVLATEQEIKDLKIKKGHAKQVNILLLVLIFLILIFLIYTLLTSEKIKKINHNLDHTNIKLKLAIESRDKFLTVISHGIRTPLYSLQESLSKLITTANSKNNEDVLLANSSITKLKHTVDNVFQFSRLQHFGKINLKNKKTDIKDFANHIMNQYAEVLKFNQKKLNVEFNIKKHHYHLPRKKLKLIISNIITNAFEEKSVSTITLKIEEKEVSLNKSSLIFSVSDDGDGISKANIDYVEKGEIGVLDENNQKGVRMGLILSNKILKKLNSKLYYKPIKNANVVYYQIDNIKTTVIKDTNENGIKKVEKKSILFVDDSSANLFLTSRTLNHIGHKCTTLDNGYDAIKLVQDKTFDLILMDINMPLIDGYETTEEIKKLNTDTPVVAYTALSEDVISNKCKAVGIEYILTKPLTELEFERALYDIFEDT